MSEEDPGRDTYPDADRAAVRDEPAPSARVQLDRERIVAAALDFIDANGLPGLTMRRLGAQLGVEAMALYRYVPSKEELLDAVVESLVAQVRDDEVVRAAGIRALNRAWSEPEALPSAEELDEPSAWLERVGGRREHRRFAIFR